MRVAFATLLSFLVIGLWPAAGADAAPTIVACQTEVSFNIHISSAKGLTCEQAHEELLKGLKSISRVFKTDGGYRCKRVSGSRLAGQWRCTKGKSRAFRFEFSD